MWFVYFVVIGSGDAFALSAFEIRVKYFQMPKKIRALILLVFIAGILGVAGFFAWQQLGSRSRQASHQVLASFTENSVQVIIQLERRKEQRLDSRGIGDALVIFQATEVRVVVTDPGCQVPLRNLRAQTQVLQELTKRSKRSWRINWHRKQVL